MIYLKYILYFPLDLAVSLICWWTNPIACLFPVRQTNGRDKLWGIFELWSTHDNPVDEGYYGGYFEDPVNSTTYSDYSKSAWLRYKFRVRWLARNTGWGWSHFLFGVPTGTGFQWKGRTKPLFGILNDYNIGWKLRPGFSRDIYASRIIGLRKVPTP